MGYFYAIMGLVSLIEGNIFASITDSYGAPIGLSALLLISVISMVITQIIAHILDKDTPYLPKNRSVDEANRFKFSKVGALLINPRFIALCVIGFCTVSCTTLTTYTQPLLASQFGLSAGTVTRIGTFCNQGTILVFASLTGVIVDKVGSAIKLFLIALGLLIVACIMVLVVPWSSPFVFIVVIAMVLIKTGDAVGKPGRQLLIPECGLSDSIRGTAIGFLNVIMALPSMLGKLFGSVLTAYSGERMGYQIIYFIFIGIAAVGIIGVLVFQASKKKANAKAAA